MAYTNAILFLDPVNGSDSNRTALTSVSFTWNAGTGKMRATKVSHGLITGAIVNITGTSGLNSAWKITQIDANTFDLNASTNVSNTSGTVTPRGGSSTSDAWKTITSGPTSSKIAPGDVVRIKESPKPTLVGNAKWTNTTKVTGGLPSAISIGSSTNASPIVMTINSNGYSDGDVVWIKSHTTNTNANGVWIIANKTTNTFELVGSIGNGIGGATGSCQLVSPACVILDTAVTKTICNCESIWTGGTGCTPSVDASVVRQHLGSLKIITDATVTTARILAKFGLPVSLDLSGYKQISFWIRNTTSALASGDILIKLYSDSACTSEVESLSVPAIASTATNTPITINKGSALSATVQGIAIYSTVTFASKTLNFDNFIACKDATADDSITLQSLISKSNSAWGGTEAWQAIQSIDDRIIILDSHTNGAVFSHRGYVGTSENVSLYKRETTKTALVSTASTVIQSMQINGTLAGGNIQYQGGWDWTDSAGGTQNGETFFDGLNTYGYGLQIDKHYITINRISFLRYYYNINGASSNYVVIDYITQLSNSYYYSMYCYGMYKVTINTVNFLVNNFSYAMVLNYGPFVIGNINYIIGNPSFGLQLLASSSVVGSILIASNNGYGVYVTGNFNIIKSIGTGSYNSYSCLLVGGNKNVISSVTLSSYNNYGLALQGYNNTVKAIATTGNVNGGVNLQGGFQNFLINAQISEATEFYNQTMYSNPMLFSQNHDLSGYEYIISDVWYAISLSDGVCGKKWKMYISSSISDIFYPAYLEVAKVYCNANAEVTVTIKVTLSNATNIGARLMVKAGQISGVPNDTYTITSQTTSEQTLTRTFTPTESGLVCITLEAYYILGSGDVTFDNITISQA